MNATWFEFFFILASGMLIGALCMMALIAYFLVDSDLVVTGGRVKWKTRPRDEIAEMLADMAFKESSVKE